MSKSVDIDIQCNIVSSGNFPSHTQRNFDIHDGSGEEAQYCLDNLMNNVGIDHEVGV